MVAAQKLYPGAEIVFPGSQEKKLRDFIAVFKPVAIQHLKDIVLSDITRLIIVDTKNTSRIGNLSDLVRKSGIDIHVYDHHPKTEDDIHGSVEVIEEVGATATIFTEILKSKKLDCTPMEATILCLGIYEETGSLLFPSTTERDLLAAAYLLKRGANLNIVSNFLDAGLSHEELELLNELVRSAKEMVIYGIRIKIAKASLNSYAGDAAHFAHRIMNMGGVDAVFVILDMEGKILIVARSRVPELNAADVMREFGGGGHPTAASATLREPLPEAIEEKLEKIIRDNVRPEKTAADIMTSPVITTDWKNTLKKIETTMTKYGVNALPVVKDSKYTGLISREIVEKAIFHGLGKNQAIDFCTTDAGTVAPDTSIREIEQMMIEQNQRFMTVLKNHQIAGAITRTDLLRSLYEDFLRREGLGKTETRDKPFINRNIANLLKDKLPAGIYDILRLAGEVGDSLKINTYLVGGLVRDLLRGEASIDIDIVAEKDGLFYAKALAEKLHAKLRTHERFGTAKIITEKVTLDVATSRTEYYESPASLPKVETSSIKKDLYRRDFTINTLAVKLNPKDFGQLMDFFGSQRDLREKTIRVLHNLSFVEDPTRAFRAVRFAERFGFKLSKHTENLIKSSLSMSVMDRLSGERLFEELLLIFNETEPVKTLKRLSELGLLRVIHPAIVFSPELESALQSMFETLAWFKLLFLEESADRGTLYLMALLSGVRDPEKQSAVKRLAIPAKLREVIEKGMTHAKVILKKLPMDDAVKLYRLLKDETLETLLFAMALSKDKSKQKLISHFLMEIRKIKPILKGDCLKRIGIPPGPLYSKLLDRLLDEKLRGNLKNKEDEEKFIKTLYKQIRN